MLQKFVPVSCTISLIVTSSQKDNMEDTLSDMQESLGADAVVDTGSKINESTTVLSELSFEEERICQRIWKESASQPLSPAYQAPVVCNNEQNMSNLMIFDMQRRCNDEHQTLKRPVTIEMDSSPCKLLFLKETAHNDHLDHPTVDRSLMIVDIMSMFNPKTLQSNASHGRHSNLGSQAHLHNGWLSSLHSRETVNSRKDAILSINYPANEDAENTQFDNEAHGTRMDKKRRLDITPISADEGNCVKDSADLFVGTSGRRNIIEPRLPKTELTKPGGKFYPWDRALMKYLLTELDPPLSDYEGYINNSTKYCGEVGLRSLLSNKPDVRKKLKNKTVHLGRKYQLKCCVGRGGFAAVYKAETGISTDRYLVALKIQKPACLWEFYIYRQLDMRIPSKERCTFGRAESIHVYENCSFLECDFGQYGTLQDVLNTYLKKGKRMDEVLCTFYTIEMLRMLETSHKVGLIHGDFKPGNLLIRCSRENLGDWAPDKPGAWKQQGVCLIDWGRCIDINLFAEGTKFVGDCKTEGFRCTEMVEKKPWTFQVDTYGLCGVAHCLLHGSCMEIDNRSNNATSPGIKRPKEPYRRYWNVTLWQYFFETLLNPITSRSYDTMKQLRGAFEEYLFSDPGLKKKLRELLMQQNTLLSPRK